MLIFVYAPSVTAKTRFPVMKRKPRKKYHFEISILSKNLCRMKSETKIINNQFLFLLDEQ